jgi:hypothetical protein
MVQLVLVDLQAQLGLDYQVDLAVLVAPLVQVVPVIPGSLDLQVVLVSLVSQLNLVVPGLHPVPLVLVVLSAQVGLKVPVVLVFHLVL